MNNISVSKREAELTSKIIEHEHLIFTPKDIQRFLNISKRNTYQLLQRMKKNNHKRRTRKIHIKRTMGHY